MSVQNSIYYAIRSAHNLTTLKLHIQWFPSSASAESRSSHYVRVASRNYGASPDADSNSEEEISPNGNSWAIRKDNSHIDLLHGSKNNTSGHRRVYHPTVKMKRNLSDMEIPSGSSDKFTAADARSLMLRTEDSILRTIAVGGVLYRVSAVKSFVSHFVFLSSVLYKPGYPLTFAPSFSLHAQLNSSAGKLVSIVIKSGGS